MSALKLHKTSEAAQPVQGDSVSSWLDVLDKLLGLPPEEAKAIREELASHLRERVRDLTVSGMAEGEAVKAAIGELGDAVELARRFQQARRPSKRSMVMQVALVSAVVVAVTAGGLAMRGASQAADAKQEAAVAKQAELETKNKALQAFTAAVLAQGTAPQKADGYEAAAHALAAAGVQPIEAQRAPVLAALMAATAGGEVGEAKVSSKATDTWKAFFENAAHSAGKGLVVNFTSMEGLNLASNDPVGVELKDVRLDEAMRLLNVSRQSDSVKGNIAYRVSDSAVEFGSEDFFDRREVETRTYDLDALVKTLLAKEAEEPGPKQEDRHSRISAEQSVCEEVSHLIENMVNSDMWVDNGGNTASIRRYASKLFITAPVRRFREIEWVLKEAGAFDQPRAAATRAATPLTVHVDPASSDLMITDGTGSAIRCRSLRLDSPDVISAVLEDARVQTSVPFLGDLPLINRNFTHDVDLKYMLDERSSNAVLVRPTVVIPESEAGVK